jgi:hypothetical protein
VRATNTLMRAPVRERRARRVCDSSRGCRRRRRRCAVVASAATARQSMCRREGRGAPSAHSLTHPCPSAAVSVRSVPEVSTSSRPSSPHSQVGLSTHGSLPIVAAPRRDNPFGPPGCLGGGCLGGCPLCKCVTRCII